MISRKQINTFQLIIQFLHCKKADHTNRRKQKMRLSTNTTATFEEWFSTLQQVASQDYDLAINNQEKGEYLDLYFSGLNQNEALNP